MDIEIRIKDGETINVIVNGEDITSRIAAFTLQARGGRPTTFEVEYPPFHTRKIPVRKEA